MKVSSMMRSLSIRAAVVSRGAAEVKLLGDTPGVPFAAGIDQKLHLDVGNGELK